MLNPIPHPEPYSKAYQHDEAQKDKHLIAVKFIKISQSIKGAYELIGFVEIFSSWNVSNLKSHICLRFITKVGLKSQKTFFYIIYFCRGNHTYPRPRLLRAGAGRTGVAAYKLIL